MCAACQQAAVLWVTVVGITVVPVHLVIGSIRLGQFGYVLDGTVEGNLKVFVEIAVGEKEKASIIDDDDNGFMSRGGGLGET